MDSAKYPLLYKVSRSEQTIDLEKDQKPELVKEIQKLLTEKGFPVGAIDGLIGPRTLSALERAKNRLNLQYPTLIGPTTIQRLSALEKAGEYFKPTNGIGLVTSKFGPRYHPTLHVYRPHRGVDIGADRGTNVYAVADGVVTSLMGTCRGENNSCGGGFGNFIRLTHSNNSDIDQSVYAHLSSINVSPGQKVFAGQVIGKIGSTGFSTGPHLHFELWKGGKAFDPEDLFDVI